MLYAIKETEFFRYGKISVHLQLFSLQILLLCVFRSLYSIYSIYVKPVSS
jgi:hypothetical protein